MPLGEGQKSVTLMAKNLKLTKGGARHPPPTGSSPRAEPASVCVTLTPDGAHAKALLTGLPEPRGEEVHQQLLSAYHVPPTFM